MNLSGLISNILCFGSNFEFVRPTNKIKCTQMPKIGSQNNLTDLQLRHYYKIVFSYLFPFWDLGDKLGDYGPSSDGKLSALFA